MKKMSKNVKSDYNKSSTTIYWVAQKVIADFSYSRFLLSVISCYF